jgi:hypothetical protein
VLDLKRSRRNKKVYNLAPKFVTPKNSVMLATQHWLRTINIENSRWLEDVVDLGFQKKMQQTDHPRTYILVNLIIATVIIIVGERKNKHRY